MRGSRAVGVAVLGALLGASGCYAGNQGVPGGPGGPGGTLDGGHVIGPGDDAGPTAPPSGLPCDVTSLIGTHCIACHNGGPAAPSATRLASYDDLVRMSSADPSQTVAQRCWIRMTDGTSPMPPRPTPTVPAAEISAFESWITAGYPRGDCGGLDAGIPDDAMNPYDTPSVCSSGTHYFGGEGTRMAPGQACVSCHVRAGEGPLYGIAGTVYPTAHEPDDCNGASPTSFAGARVIITGATGTELTLTPNSAGNFYSLGAVALPYTARVVYDGRERIMATAQMNGDCNVCHTETGTMMAPGRVMLP